MLVENKPDWSGRWSHLQKLLMRSGPLAHQDFEPGSQVKRFSRETNFYLFFPEPSLLFMDYPEDHSVRLIKYGTDLQKQKDLQYYYCL